MLAMFGGLMVVFGVTLRVVFGFDGDDNDVRVVFGGGCI